MTAQCLVLRFLVIALVLSSIADSQQQYRRPQQPPQKQQINRQYQPTKPRQNPGYQQTHQQVHRAQQQGYQPRQKIYQTRQDVQELYQPRQQAYQPRQQAYQHREEAYQPLGEQRPIVQRPTVQKPTVRRPAIQRPTVQRPIVQRPTVQRPTVQRPTVQRPTVQRPTDQMPTVQRPTIQRPSERIPIVMPPNKTQQRKQTGTRQVGDLIGRSKVHPNQIPRFQKYFQSPDALMVDPRGSAAPGVAGQSDGPDLIIENHSHDIDDHHHDHAHDHGDHGHSHKTEKALKDHMAIIGQVDMEPATDTSNCNPEPNHEIDGTEYLVTAGMRDCPPMTWSEATDFCQSNLMSIVSLGKSVDTVMTQKLLEIPTQFGGPGFWTGGYVTHPDNNRVSNSIIWSSMSRETEIVRPGQGFFSSTGETGQPQPDNWEFVASGRQDRNKEEHCVAVLNNKYNDGRKLHDLNCNKKLPVVCKVLSMDAMDSSTMML